MQIPRAGLRSFKLLSAFFLSLLPLSLFLYKSCHHDGFNTCSVNGYHNYKHNLAMLSPNNLTEQFYARPIYNTTVDLVLATVKGDSIDWLQNVHRTEVSIRQHSRATDESQPFWVVKKFVADDRTSPYHPAKNKGREATMYFTYLVNHYDRLPDITIFIHAHEDPWHVEEPLLESMTETLNLLDLEEVRRRGYANLRMGWANACPDPDYWMRTDRQIVDDEKEEEPYMARAFVENFSPTNSTTDITLPEGFGVPCCSQFAVSKETILQRPRSDYERMLHNLLTTDLSDYIYGRTWEHLWQYLFLEKTVDCPVEWKAYCSLYHVCFSHARQLQDFYELNWEQYNIRQTLGLVADLAHPVQAAGKRQKIRDLRKRELELRDEALKRGTDANWRQSIGDIYIT